MKLVIKRNEFLKMLSFAAQAVPVKSAENQFLNFLINCEPDKISVITSDGTASIKVTQGMKDKEGHDVIFNIEPGMIQAPAKLLLDFVANLKGDTVTLTMVDTNFLNISDGISDSNLVTKSGDEYPDVDLSIPEDNPGFTTDLADLKKLFDATSYAVATKGSKDLFYGINVRAHEGKLFFMATDSYRMARYAVKSQNSQAEFSFTCPVKALSYVTSISDSGPITVYYDQNKAIFVSDNMLLSTRLLRGDFPSADRLIPPSFPYRIKLETQEFTSASDLVKIVSAVDDKNSQVRFTATKSGQVTLSANSANYGNAKVPLQHAEVTLPEGEEVFEISFNIDFVLQAVKALGSSSFTLVFTSPTSMFMLQNDDPENVQILTPIRISSFN